MRNEMDIRLNSRVDCLCEYGEAMRCLVICLLTRILLKTGNALVGSRRRRARVATSHRNISTEETKKGTKKESREEEMEYLMSIDLSPLRL